jgi:ACS family hexuronate transporter-like MFS transporter
MSSPANKSNLRWVVCGLLFLATAINYMDRTALGLVEPMLKHILGGDQNIALYNRRYSDIVNCFIFAYGLGFLVAGRVVDRVGVKKGYALSIAVWALSSLSHVFARTPVGFGMARFALGIGESGNFPSALKATADWFPAEERALATGIFNSGTSAGALIAPMMLAGCLLHHEQSGTALAHRLAVVSLQPATTQVRHYNEGCVRRATRGIQNSSG